MPVIAYQSFNANSSKNHGLSALALQRFTKEANKHATSHGHQALVPPSDTMDISTPIEGPAQLKPIEVLSDKQPVSVFGTQIALLWQNFYRVFGAMPDIMVCGEMDSSNSDFSSVVTDPKVALTPHPAKMACQSFTAVSQSTVASKLLFIKSGEGFVLYMVGDLIVCFVHVPNKIATSKSAVEQFYFDIASYVNSHGAVIHVVLGDTNQPSFNFTTACLNIAFNTTAYVNASNNSSVEKIDNWNVTEKGTNATGTKMYDIAVYRSDVVELKKGTAYVSQSSSAVTITDHCGLGLHVELKKTV
ncbi:hypothetical protein [Acidisphaera sp. S103]|uniref:hypothetical protein n=1 Tax=Acidisphaera sp. S103 TaxID=1747223 RepID=UPI00131ABC6F|nr:hypothetical protein [Acidisphaera sp. S103]